MKMAAVVEFFRRVFGLKANPASDHGRGMCDASTCLFCQRNAIPLLERRFKNSNFGVIVEPDRPTGPLEISNVAKDSVTLKWQPPEEDGGSEILFYQVEAKDVLDPDIRKTYYQVDAPSTETVVTGLKCSHIYQFRVYAVNQLGRGEALVNKTLVKIKRVTKRPETPPKPQVEVIEEDGNVVSLTWSSMADQDPSVSYVVERHDANADRWLQVNRSDVLIPRYKIEILSPNVEHKFRVTSESRGGVSSPSEPSDVIILKPAKCDHSPEIVTSLKDSQVEINGTISFYCTFLSDSLPEITWFVDGARVYDGLSAKIITKKGESALTFEEVNEELDGCEVRCEIRNCAGKVSSEARLHVTAPAKIVKSSLYDDELLFCSGETLRIRAGIYGRPVPETSWSFNGKVRNPDVRTNITKDGNSHCFVVEDVSAGDTGTYSLKIWNEFSEDQMSVDVSVLGPNDSPNDSSAITSQSCYIDDVSFNPQSTNWENEFSKDIVENVGEGCADLKKSKPCETSISAIDFENDEILSPMESSYDALISPSPSSNDDSDLVVFASVKFTEKFSDETIEPMESVILTASGDQLNSSAAHDNATYILSAVNPYKCCVSSLQMNNSCSSSNSTLQTSFILFDSYIIVSETLAIHTTTILPDCLTMPVAIHCMTIVSTDSSLIVTKPEIYGSNLCLTDFTVGTAPFQPLYSNKLVFSSRDLWLTFRDFLNLGPISEYLIVSYPNTAWEMVKPSVHQRFAIEEKLNSKVDLMHPLITTLFTEFETVTEMEQLFSSSLLNQAQGTLRILSHGLNDDDDCTISTAQCKMAMSVLPYRTDINDGFDDSPAFYEESYFYECASGVRDKPHETLEYMDETHPQLEDLFNSYENDLNQYFLDNECALEDPISFDDTIPSWLKQVSPLYALPQETLDFTVFSKEGSVSSSECDSIKDKSVEELLDIADEAQKRFVQKTEKIEALENILKQELDSLEKDIALVGNIQRSLGEGTSPQIEFSLSTDVMNFIKPDFTAKPSSADDLIDFTTEIWDLDIDHDDNEDSSKDGFAPQITSHLQNRIVVAGNRIRLFCCISSDPDPEIEWFKNGTKIPEKRRYVYNTLNDYGMCSLDIYSSKVSDSGEFTCVASNVHGSASTQAFLRVVGIKMHRN